MSTREKMVFGAWLDAVDVVLGRITGMGYDDLPDMLWHDWYDEGLTPNQAASRAIKEADL